MQMVRAPPTARASVSHRAHDATPAARNRIATVIASSRGGPGGMSTWFARPARSPGR